MSHAIKVNQHGVELSYIDSGPPEGQTTYRTVIAIHGYGWSSGVFEKVLPAARKKGIRFIALNRRGFPGSTAYSKEELDVMKSPGAGIPDYLKFLQRRGLELIGFVHHAVENLKLPVLGPDGKGCITILGWSLGNVYSFSVLGCFNDTDLPSAWKNTVKEAISSVLLFDPPLEACGIRPSEQFSSWPEKVFVENQDPTDPTNPIRGAKAVNDWVSGWFQYNHSQEPANREDFIQANDHPIRPSTIGSAPDAQRLLKASYPPSFESEDLIMAGLTNGAFRVIALYVLDKANRQKTSEKEARPPFTDVGEDDLLDGKKLNWLWCENGAWPSAYNPHVHRKEYGFDGSDPNRKMVAIPNANHFVQWEDPERFIDYVLPLL